jgi:hypothetical protein
MAGKANKRNVRALVRRKVGKDQRHFANAVRCDPHNIRTVALLGASMLPGKSAGYLRTAYRVTKAAVMIAIRR